MLLRNFKRLLAFIAVIAVVLVSYGLMTMKEKPNPIGITNNALHPLLPGADVGSARP